MKLAIRVLLTAAALAGAAAAQRAGDLPPALTWDKLKGKCPASLDWASLRGRVVVIAVNSVFPGIADSKSLTEKFHDQPAVFLLVFNGSEFLLDQEIAQSSYSGCVLFDETGANARNFGAIPYADRTVVVDDRGFIAGWATEGVDAAVASLLKHEVPAGLSETAHATESQSSAREARADPTPSLLVQISLAAKDEPRSITGFGKSGRYVTTNFPLRVIISDLWEMPMARTTFPDNFDERPYDVIANMPVDDSALARTLVQEAVANHFGLRIEKETRAESGYALTAAPNPSPHLQPAKEGSYWTSIGSEVLMSGTGADMEEIAREFENVLEAPVIDQTGLKGKFDYFASSKLQGAESAFDMANQLGLTLTRIEQPLEILVVTAQQLSPK